MLRRVLWSPGTHALFGPRFRAAATCLMLAHRRLAASADGPVPPADAWRLVLAFAADGWFGDADDDAPESEDEAVPPLAEADAEFAEADDDDDDDDEAASDEQSGGALGESDEDSDDEDGDDASGDSDGGGGG